eukprot:Phypoly_transcript_26843.p1 GENE.Phypoly_transcript_26843~~Phypoly_transcript_26843.p1  ORF type:complete len:142 (+),score=16.95 Phypoly_transcript_26843:46-426(+)
MESEVNELELLFQSVDADLQVIKHKLETEFSGSFESKSSQNNPFKLMKRIKRLQDELGPLKEDMTAIMATKQLLTTTSNSLIENGKSLSSLQSRAAIEPVKVASNTLYTDLLDTSSQLTPSDFIIL